MSKEPNPILDSRTSTSNVLNRRGKNLRQFVQGIGQKKEKKIDVVMRYALACERKNSQRFLKTFNVYSTGALSQLILRIVSALIDSL